MYLASKLVSTRYQVSRRKTNRKKKERQESEKWNENEHHALRGQAESWRDKFVVCWYSQSYDVSSWWTTDRRRKRTEVGQAQMRAETKPKKQEHTATRWSVFFEFVFSLCFEMIRCDIAWHIAIYRNNISRIMLCHTKRCIETLESFGKILYVKLLRLKLRPRFRLK